MSEVITLSSSEEEEPASPPKKKIKPNFLGEVSIIPIKTNKVQQKNESENIVILSDEDEQSLETFSLSTKASEIIKKIETTDCNGTINDDDNDSITFIEDKNDILVNNNKNVEHENESNTDEEECLVIDGQQCSDKDGIEENKEECCIINDENSSAESSGKENKLENLTLPVNNDLAQPSTSAESSHTVLEKFLNICGETIRNSQYEHLENKQFPVLRKYYKKSAATLKDSTTFLKLIEGNMERVQKSPAAAVISFNEIFQYVKELVDAESIEVSEENKIKLKKLEKTIKLLVHKIKQLENIEVNFDDDEDSSYIMLDRFINRLNKVHEKYCQLLKKNPYSGRITYERLDFVDSEYNEINKSINKKYKNNKKFPSYIEMEEHIKKVVADHNLPLSEGKIKSESAHCFKKLGELLQTRRKKELYDAHYLYIRDSDDPASKDTSLDSTLRQNYTEGQIKIEKVCDEYCSKEKSGVEPVLSEEDSDKSDYVDSENEETNSS